MLRVEALILGEDCNEQITCNKKSGHRDSMKCKIRHKKKVFVLNQGENEVSSEALVMSVLPSVKLVSSE